ncbi:hypothetical protein [Planctopirus hydrillae]|uniref:hypothetical protein n=1 Tax=Planctopirus hydrillae TaxID=1841610 RepID=UPI00104256BE|nr:hypothetical protein [Planctopirus hydrillae]
MTFTQALLYVTSEIDFRVVPIPPLSAEYFSISGTGLQEPAFLVEIKLALSDTRNCPGLIACYSMTRNQ